MKTKLVRVGNSRGVRIPQVLLKESGLSDEVDISVEDGAVILRPVSNARATWGSVFTRLGSAEPDPALDNDGLATMFDQEEWTWP
ncbi:MAG: AbrB/MazE/SpoVT family DNA-binding domain-containing protein [Tepidiformaceae bacterium]